MFRPEIPELVDRVMLQDHPRLWRDLPGPVRRAVVERVQDQLPAVVGRVTDEIGIHIDQLLDPKIMVIDHFRENPSLVVRIFRDFGQRELNLMVAFGFVFGFILGIPVAVVDHVFGVWWLLPVLGVVVGWLTNALGMWLIFEPPEPRRILGISVHGLFPRRQDEAAEVYARIIADDVITLERIGDFLLDGPRGDRTRSMLATALRPAIDRAAGPARAAVRVAVGPARFDTIRESVAREAVGRTLTPFRDPVFSRRQAEKIRALVATRTKELPPRDFVEMMRAAIKEDEWMLYAPRRDHGTRRGLPAPVAVRGRVDGERHPRGPPRCAARPGPRRRIGLVAHHRVGRAYVGARRPPRRPRGRGSGRGRRTRARRDRGGHRRR